MVCRLNNFLAQRAGQVVFLVFASLLAGAQPKVWTEMVEKFPDESAVYLTRNKAVTLEVKGDSVTARSVVEESILFLKDRPDNLSDMRIHGSHFQEIEGLQAATRIWEKSRYKEIPLSGLTRQREDNSDIFYDDSYFYHLSFPAGHAGNQAVWSFREKYRDARFLPAFFFQSYLPQVSGTFSVIARPEVELKWRVLNDADQTIQFRRFERNGWVHYEWKGNNLPAFRLEEGCPSISYFVPMVVCYVTAINSEKGRIPVLGGLDDIHRWYASTLRSMRESPPEPFTEFARSIVLPTDTELEKVRRIFYWVQDNIRYIAFEDGMRGLVPHPPSYVLEKRYGDCKDMSSLIVGLLRALGIEAHYTWIGTRDIPFQYSMFPSPLVDNHMIATYIDSLGNHFFLDGTGNYTPLGLPSSMIQGKEAFILKNDSTYEVKKVPELPAGISSNIDSVRLRLDGNVLRGKGTIQFSGYQKIFASYDFNRTTSNAQREYLTYWLSKGSNKFILDRYTISEFGTKEQPLHVSYDFQVSDYVSRVGPEIFVNLNLVKTYHNKIIKSDRKVPIEFDYTYSSRRVFCLDIPSGYEVEYMPPDSRLENGILDFAISYRREGSSICMTQHLENHILMLRPDQFQVWNAAIRQLSDSYKESIILKKKML
jgi:hypothetical protein